MKKLVGYQVLKPLAFLIVFAGFTAGAHAQITVSGGLALSAVNAGESDMGLTIENQIGVGGNVYVDYLLPINIPLSLGLEVGVDGSSFKTKAGDNSFTDTVVAIPILFRLAYHFDIISKLDLYGVAKIGFVPAVWSGDLKDAVEKMPGVSIDPLMGVGFGIDVGAAYYFTSVIGIFGEAGFDGYMLQSKMSWTNGSSSFSAPFYRFLTVGISYKR